jgi:DNA-binding transcriptional LysR family regulator
VTLRQLEILRALLRHRTTVAAAEELALSQPAVSNALKTMETQLGFPLFDRINNRLHPTREALAIQQESDAIFALHGQLGLKLRNLRDSRSGHLGLVATPPLAYSLIPPALRSFLAPRPALHVSFDVRRYESVVDAVLNRVAELGFVLGFAHHPGIAARSLHHGEMVCVLAPDHPLAARRTITPADLDGHALIGLERGTRLGEAVRASFAARAVPFRASVEVRYCNTACVLAAARVGAAIVDPFSPLQGSHDDLVIRPFLPRTPCVASVLWSEAQPLSRLAQSFLGEIIAGTTQAA